MKGLVIQTTGSRYNLILEDKRQITCQLRGKLRLGKEKLTNPIAVGDWVVVDTDAEHGGWVICEILERKNYIVRQSPRKKFHKHIIAANIDQAVLICSIAKPRTPLGFIDRFLVAAESYHIPAVIIVNKSDIITQKEKSKLNTLLNVYSNLGYKVIQTSTIDGTGIEKVRDIFKNKMSLCSGYSGVGKSSIANALNPDLNLRTAEISRKSEKGMHTTTFAEIHQIEEGSFIIDTPGIKELGIVNIEPEELSGYFKEMKSLVSDCKFNNCMHRNEPSCVVLKAVENGEIAESRYISYLNILESLEEINYWERL